MHMYALIKRKAVGLKQRTES